MYFAGCLAVFAELPVTAQAVGSSPCRWRTVVEIYVELHWEMVMNTNEAVFWMYFGRVITENMMINKGSLSSVCRLSAALMQIAAIFSVIACLCYSQLTVYPSGWFIVLYRQAPIGLHNEGPIIYAFTMRFKASLGTNISIVTEMIIALWCLNRNDLKISKHITDWLTGCLHTSKEGGLSCSGVTEDKILSPLRQMEALVGRGGRELWWVGVVDIFLRHTRMAVSGKAAMSSHLTHNPI